MSAELNQGTLDAALEISARRANTLRQIKELILEGKKERAWNLLLQYLEIKDNQSTKPVKFPRPVRAK